jgi:hypothetical protein
MKRKLLILLLAILLAAPALFSEELPNVFPLFLSKLIERHEELKTIAMPDVEVLTAPGFEDEAVYMAYFKTPEDRQLFYSALQEENIPYLIPDDDKRIGLFHTDLLVFLMKAAIGL